MTYQRWDQNIARNSSTAPLAAAATHGRGARLAAPHAKPINANTDGKNAECATPHGLRTGCSATAPRAPSRTKQEAAVVAGSLGPVRSGRRRIARPAQPRKNRESEIVIAPGSMLK